MAFIGILAFSFLHGVNNCGCSSHTYSVTIPFSLKKFVKTHGSAVFGCWQFWFDEKILPYFSLDTFGFTTKKSWKRKDSVVYWRWQFWFHYKISVKTQRLSRILPFTILVSRIKSVKTQKFCLGLLSAILISR